MGVKETFWTNVDWHRRNKRMSWLDLVGGNTSTVIRKTRNVTLDTVEEIAALLKIDDYAILFEEVEENKE